MPSRSIALCEDETYHPKICLVAIEPVSNFILLEQYAQNRDASTWDDAVAKALAGLPIQVEQVTSDEAKGIKKHVKETLGAPHNSDLFHVQQEISKGTSFPLKAAQRRAEEALQKAREETQKVVLAQHAYARGIHGPGRPPDFAGKVAKAQEQERFREWVVQRVTEQREEMKAANRALGEIYHPFDLKTGACQGAKEVEKKLLEQFGKMEKIAEEAPLSVQSVEKIRKAKRVLPSLVASIAWVHRQIGLVVAALGLSEVLLRWMQDNLIPGLYLQRAAAKAKSAELRKRTIAQAHYLLRGLKEEAGPWVSLPEERKKAVWEAAQRCANLFVRSSSCVEGRNGQLALRHHHLHQLRAGKLRALTVVANYFVSRADGTTAAERFFGGRPRELFEVLCERLPWPARPRSRKRSTPAPLWQAVG
jgi:hypothetical protein